MPELSPAEQAKLRQLEEEVDRDLENLRKQREALKNPPAVVEGAGGQGPRSKEESAARLPVPVKKKQNLPAKRPEQGTSAWKGNLRRNIAIGTGGVLLTFAVLQNLAMLIACGAVVGGVYWASGRFLKDESERPEEPEEEEAPEEEPPEK